MLDGGRISSKQLIYMLAFTVLGTAYFFLPSITAKFAGRDFWLTPVFSTIPGLLVILVITKLYNLYPGLSIVQYADQILGKFVGKIAGFLFIFWLVYTNSIIIQELGEFMNIGFMQKTPTLFFNIAITALSGLAVYYGVELVARTAQFLFPVFLILVLGLLVLGLGEVRFANITPFLSKGLVPVLAGSVPPSGWRGEVVMAAMLFPFLNKQDKTLSTGIYAVLLIGLLLFVDSLHIATIFGEQTKRMIFPVLIMAREINILDFFQRMEVVLLAAWLPSHFVKVAVWYYCAALGFAQWAGLKTYRPVVLPVGVILLALSTLNFRNIVDLAEFITLTWPLYGLSIELILPGVMLVVALLFRKRR